METLPERRCQGSQCQARPGSRGTADQSSATLIGAIALRRVRRCQFSLKPSNCMSLVAEENVRRDEKTVARRFVAGLLFVAFGRHVCRGQERARSCLRVYFPRDSLQREACPAN